MVWEFKFVDSSTLKLKCSFYLHIILQICYKRLCTRVLPALGADCSGCCAKAQGTIFALEKFTPNWKIKRYLISNLVDGQWQRQ